MVVPELPTDVIGDKHSERQTIEVNPCTEDGKVTLESILKTEAGVELKEPYFDSVKLCEALKKIKNFSKVRCSSEMGYAIVEYEDKRIHVFKEGKIIIRRAKDRDDAVKTLQLMNKILSEAVLRKS
jgi:ArsR family metal-binding transcriptional regulator